MANKEEGELSGSDCCIDNADYEPVLRPERPLSTLYRNVSKQVISSDDDDSEDSNDSDTELHSLSKRKKSSVMDFAGHESTNVFKPLINPVFGTIPKKKKNNIWADVIQEESIIDNVSSVGLKKIPMDRSVESYDYTNALLVQHEPEENNAIELDEHEESPEEIEKRMNRKRRFMESRLDDKREKDGQPKDSTTHRNLIEIVVEPDMTQKEFGFLMAEALYEHKPELIVRVVETIGQEISLKIYNKTCEIEKEGGMLINNGGRRRTSGGVFLQILKKFDGVEKQHLDEIFAINKLEEHMWRKRRKANRKRHNSKPQEKLLEEGMNLKSNYSDDPGGTKCPGSTPVTTPQGSDIEEDSCIQNNINSLNKVCEKAAVELNRQIELEIEPSTEDMDIF